MWPGRISMDGWRPPIAGRYVVPAYGRPPARTCSHLPRLLPSCVYRAGEPANQESSRVSLRCTRPRVSVDRALCAGQSGSATWHPAVHSSSHAPENTENFRVSVLGHPNILVIYFTH